MIPITSKNNQRIKFARKIAGGNNSGFVFVEGERLVREVVELNFEDTEIFISESFADKKPDFLSECGVVSQKVYLLPEKIFRTLAQTKSSQGIASICPRPKTGQDIVEDALRRPAKEGNTLILALHEINNPSNLGAILRTALASDVIAILITENSTDPFSPKALRGAMGATLKIPIWDGITFTRLIEWAGENGLITTCADISGKRNYVETDWTKPRILIFGSEARGMDYERLAMIDETISIPLENSVESLNIGVSCGVILFEALRQRRLNQ